jgi:hypothetical protein
MAPRASEAAMKKTRFTEEQTVTILREADERPCRTWRRSTL